MTTETALGKAEEAVNQANEAMKDFGGNSPKAQHYLELAKFWLEYAKLTART